MAEDFQFGPLLEQTARRARIYVEQLTARRVAPDQAMQRALTRLTTPLQDEPMQPEAIIELLDRCGAPGTVATTGGRYFGFVIGGALPATVAANWLATAWDQNAAFTAMSPMAAAVERCAVQWVRELLCLPEEAFGGCVTCATMANFSGLAAARHALLRQCGWDVERQGLFEAPPLSVFVSEEVHVSVLKALSLLGLGRDRVTRIPVDEQGRVRSDELPELNDRSIVCIQAGNVNTGSFDPASEICTRARDAGAWTHVDGAFGMWAAASPNRGHLVDGFELADSWALDAHKWLNVPYDCGIVLCRSPRDLRAAMVASAAYLGEAQPYEPCHFVPEMSRRARGIEVWAALRSLGRFGLADLVERCCDHAARFTKELVDAGFEILNDVVLNQVLVSFGDDATTNRVIDEVQREGTCWCGGTEWQGRSAMRISVSSWATTDSDVEQSLDAIIRLAASVRP